MLQEVKKIYYMFDKRAKKQILLLYVLMVISSVLEAFSISFVLLFIGAANNSLDLKSIRWLSSIYDFRSFGTPRNILIWVGIFMLGIYIFKNLFLLFQVYFQNKFIFNQQARISSDLLKRYLSAPYTFYFKRNTAELIRNLTFSIDSMFGNGLVPFMFFVSESLVVIAVFGLLFFVEPVVAFSVLIILGSLTLFFYRQVRSKILQLGDKGQDAGTRILLWAKQSLGGVKEIKLLGRESFFMDLYSNSRFEAAKYNVFFLTMQRVPRLYLEIIIICGVLIITLVILSKGNNSSDLISVAGLFAMASMRLMPSISQIANSLNSIKFGTAAIDNIYNDMYFFREFSSQKADVYKHKETFSKLHEIRLENLGFSYPDNNVPAVSNIDLAIQGGMSVAFVGSSGAGKSTLMDILLGLLKPDKGRLLVNGIDVYKEAEVLSAWQSSIGYVPQNIYLIDDSIRKNIAFGINEDIINEERLWEVLAQAHLKEFVKNLPEGLDTQLGELGIRLSGGQKQRIGIARALYSDPQVLMMDEATSSLDYATESGIAKAIEELSGEKTIIIIAHRLTTVQKCSRLYFIKDGRLANSGTFDELIQKDADFSLMAYPDTEQ